MEKASQQQGQKWSEPELSSYYFPRLLGCFLNSQGSDGTVSGHRLIHREVTQPSNLGQGVFKLTGTVSPRVAGGGSLRGVSRP